MKRYDEWMTGVAALEKAAGQKRGTATMARRLREAVENGERGFVEAVAKAAVLRYRVKPVAR